VRRYVVDERLAGRAETFASKKSISHSITSHITVPSANLPSFKSFSRASSISHCALTSFSPLHLRVQKIAFKAHAQRTAQTSPSFGRKSPDHHLPLYGGELDLPQGAAAIKARFRGQNIQILNWPPTPFLILFEGMTAVRLRLRCRLHSSFVAREVKILLKMGDCFWAMDEDTSPSSTLGTLSSKTFSTHYLKRLGGEEMMKVYQIGSHITICCF
jgi:hypothetical protein